MLAIAVFTPLRAFAQTPPPPPPPPAADTGAPPMGEKPMAPQAPAAMPPAPPAVMATPPAPVPPPPAAPAAPAPKLTWGGLVDTYYLFNFIRADGANTLTPPVGRAFDTNANSFTMALAKVSLNAALDPVSFQVDLGYGSTGTIINGSTGGPSFLLEQAFGTISLPGNLTLDFGKFVTTAGAEVIEANKNWLYSRSFLFNAIPLLHTGVRANLKVSDQLSLQASLVNGWNNDPDNNAWKTLGLSASITVNPMASIIATTYIGKEATQPATGGTPGDVRVLVDIVAAFTLSDRFGLNLNLDYIDAPNASPFGTVPLPNPDSSSDYVLGAAVMGRYVVSDRLNVAARGEFIRTHVSIGAASANNNAGEGTVMVGLPVGKNFELRPEVRGDFSGDPVFAPGKKSQFTGEVAALAYF